MQSTKSAHTILCELAECLSVESDDPIRLHALEYAHKNLPVPNVICLELVPSMLSCLKSKNYEIRLQGLSLLCKLTSETMDYNVPLVNGGAVVILIDIMNEGKTGISKDLMEILDNLLASTVPIRNFIINYGLFYHLMNVVLMDLNVEQMQTICCSLHKLCSNLYHPLPSKYIEQLLHLLELLRGQTDQQIVTDILWSLIYILSGENVDKQKLIDSKLRNWAMGLENHSIFLIATMAKVVVSKISDFIGEQWLRQKLHQYQIKLSSDRRNL